MYIEQARALASVQDPKSVCVYQNEFLHLSTNTSDLVRYINKNLIIEKKKIECLAHQVC